MSLSRDLHTVIGRLDVAIAGAATYGRVDLDRLRRELHEICLEAHEYERREKTECMAFATLSAGIERSIADQRAVLRSAKAKKAQGVTAVHS